LGYLFKKLHYPLAPLVLAIVIGDKAEMHSPIHADVEGLAWNIFCKTAGDNADLAWRGAAVDAGDLANDRQNDAAIAVNAMMSRQNKLTAETPRRF